VTHDPHSLLAAIRRLHEHVWRAVLSAGEKAATADLGKIARDDEGDTIYAIDCVSEDIIVDFFEREIAPTTPVVLIAEGLAGGQIVLPRGSSEKNAIWRIIMDPIDGTRSWMYQKRSAWILTGVAPNLGPETNLADIVLAVQTEIPLVKQHLLDSVWAFRGEGVHAERINRLTGERAPLPLQPSRAETIAHGFAMLSRFFPGARDEMAAIDEEIIHEALGPIQPGKAQCFEDQYISTGGQLYELMSGHDRFTADLRPLMEALLNRRGLVLGICCHPYDLCTELVARECGVIITDLQGNPVRAALSVEPDVAWIGYANQNIRKQIEPLLQAALKKRGLLEALRLVQ
jgi:fructose-1,6-bisphosphatase/inositol monophosphatase family enzyme